jgi:mannose-6-phosphate isomerase-like protein (cupin superfamily)
MSGFVIHEAAVESRREEGDTAAEKVTIDERAGCEDLEQRLIRFAPGRSRERTAPEREEVLFVVTGTGTLVLEGAEHPLEPEMGAYVRPGERYVVDNPGPGELTVVSVLAPRPDEPANGARKVTVRAADMPLEPAGKDREFRYVVNSAAGCRDVTQFVGKIPPGRAKTHYHLYDEVIYILEGEGVLHLEGHDDTPIAAGSCIHLPPPLPHCLENTGNGWLRVLGVFHPSGSPAEAYNLPTSEGEQGGDR